MSLVVFDAFGVVKSLPNAEGLNAYDAFGIAKGGVGGGGGGGGGSDVIFTDPGEPQPDPAAFPDDTLWIEVLV